MPSLVSPSFHGLSIALALAATCGGWAAAGAQSLPAQPATTDGDTIRLSDAERDAILNSNTEASAAAARGELTGQDSPGLGIHGEVGVMIGSNGTRGAYGTAAIPLGDNGGAVVSFETSRFGYGRSRLSPR